MLAGSCGISALASAGCQGERDAEFLERELCPDPVVGRGEGQARLGQGRQRARPVSLSGGQPGDPGVDHGLEGRAAVDPCRRPRCGQHGRGGLVFAPLQVDARSGQVGDDLSHPVRHGAVFGGSPGSAVQRRVGGDQVAVQECYPGLQ